MADLGGWRAFTLSASFFICLVLRGGRRKQPWPALGSRRPPWPLQCRWSLRQRPRPCRPIYPSVGFPAVGDIRQEHILAPNQRWARVCCLAGRRVGREDDDALGNTRHGPNRPQARRCGVRVGHLGTGRGRQPHPGRGRCLRRSHQPGSPRGSPSRERIRQHQGPRQLRCSARRPRRRRGLRRDAASAACRVDHQGPGSGQGRAVREADGRQPSASDGHGGDGGRSTAASSWKPSCTAPIRRPPSWRNWCATAPSARCARSTPATASPRPSIPTAGCIATSWPAGGIMDVGCYPVSMARLLAGEEPDEVTGFATLEETGRGRLGLRPAALP